MKRMVIIVALLVFPLLAVAQTPPKGQMLLIHEEIARPSMLMQYDASLREILAALTEKKADPSIFGMSLFVTPEFHYIYIVPISNYGALDKFQAAWMAVGEQVGKAKWQAMMDRANASMESYNETVAMLRPDLSYMPANPRLKMDEQKYVQIQFYYVIPGKEMEAEAIAKDYGALFKQKNIPDGFNVYWAMNGTDLPLLVVTSAGRSRADYYANDEKVNATLGNDVRPLQARALAITRRYEIRESMAHPELSFPMMAASK